MLLDVQGTSWGPDMIDETQKAGNSSNGCCADVLLGRAVALGVLIDLRDEACHAHMRIRRSVSIPFERLLDLLFELPDTSIPIALLGPQQVVEQAQQMLEERGWRVPVALVDDQVLWSAAKAMGLTESGDVRPIDRHLIFNPSPFLVDVIHTVEEGLKDLAVGDGTSDGSGGDRLFTCCDVGCGSGRDAIWLTKRGRWRVRCVDRLVRCLDRLQRLSALHGVSSLLTCEQAVIKAGIVTPSDTQPLFDTHTFDLVVCVRFLEREFFRALARMVRLGGYLLFVSFVKVDGVEYESPKDPKRLLAQGELRNVFCEQGGFKSVVDRLDQLPDGRYVSGFLARKVLLQDGDADAPAASVYELPEGENSTGDCTMAVFSLYVYAKDRRSHSRDTHPKCQVEYVAITWTPVPITPVRRGSSRAARPMLR